jgi:hypothetical protein
MPFSSSGFADSIIAHRIIDIVVSPTQGYQDILSVLDGVYRTTECSAEGEAEWPSVSGVTFGGAPDSRKD